MGFFKAASLPNIAVTAPYMHDGSIATLEEMLEHYAAGRRKIAAECRWVTEARSCDVTSRGLMPHGVDDRAVGSSWKA